jgi:phage shock protein PspC (stress-responsive transcriptional regulator)
MDKNKRLYRSLTNRVFAGICGGLGEYFSIDPVLVRLIWLLVVIFTGVVPGLLTYIIAIYVIPQEVLSAIPAPTPAGTI